MKLAEIHVGDFYAVKINARQIIGLPEDRWLLARREGLLWRVQRAGGGPSPHRKARVVAIEEAESGRKVVRVECVAPRSRTLERREDNYDGTWTEWRGYVVGEDGRDVTDEETFEAVIQSQQVIDTWTEAVVRHGVWQAERELRRPDRFNHGRWMVDGGR